MKKMLLFLMIVGAVGLYGSLKYHFILLDENIKILEKNELTLRNTFVDGRGPNFLKLLGEPDLLKAGFKDLLGQNQSLSIPTKP
jgi:hypothetical protein